LVGTALHFLIGIHNKNGVFKKVYVWTLAKESSIDRYFRVHGVDGVLVNPPTIKEAVQIALSYGRLATRDDSPWAVFKP
jgi:hypothetical protein